MLKSLRRVVHAIEPTVPVEIHAAVAPAVHCVNAVAEGGRHILEHPRYQSASPQAAVDVPMHHVT